MDTPYIPAVQEAENLPYPYLAYSILSKLTENTYTIFLEGGNYDSVVHEGKRTIRSGKHFVTQKDKTQSFITLLGGATELKRSRHAVSSCILCRMSFNSCCISDVSRNNWLILRLTSDVLDEGPSGTAILLF